MPQMSPLFWTLLYIMFYMTFYIFSIKLFFISIMSLNAKNNSSGPHMKFNWPW